MQYYLNFFWSDKWKMKKIIRKVLEPEKTFEQWALSNDVEISKHRFKPNKKAFIRWISTAALALAVCMAFIFPIILYSGYLAPDADHEPKFYMENEVTSNIPVENVADYKALEKFFKSNNILFFDFSRILAEDFRPLKKDIANDVKDLILSYYVENYPMSLKNDKSKGFFVNFRVVTYKNYEFVGKSNYSGLSPLYKDNKPIAVQYKLNNFNGVENAFVNFSYGGYNYFLQIKEIKAGELTVECLTAESLQEFLLGLFT